MGGWLDTDNRAISVQLNLTGTATGTELGNKLDYFLAAFCIFVSHDNSLGMIRNHLTCLTYTLLTP